MRILVYNAIAGIFIIIAFLIFSANSIQFNQNSHNEITQNRSIRPEGSLNAITMASILEDDDFVPNDTLGFAVGDTGLVLMTTNGGIDWCQVPFPSSVTLHSLSFPGFNEGWIAGDSGKIFKSVSSGDNWFEQPTATANRLNGVFFKSAVSGWAVGDGGTIIKTTDGGSSWTPQISGTLKSLSSVFIPKDTLMESGYISGDSGKVYKNVFGDWLRLNTPTTVHLRSVFFVTILEGWSAGDSGKIIYTSNGGAAWTTQTTPTQKILRSLFFTSATTGFAAGDSGVCLKTTNGGALWDTLFVPSNKKQLNSICFSSPSGWIAGSGYDSSIFRTTNLGTSWALQQPECIIGISNISTNVPTSSMLHQNYPNPFNPVTQFNFDVSKQAVVKLSVYDITGREIEVIFNDKLSPGSYKASWDASGFASGIYFYTIVLSDISNQGIYFSETKKMVLIK